MGIVDPLSDGAENTDKANRIMKYGQDRDNADRDTTSRLRYLRLLNFTAALIHSFLFFF